MPRPAPPSYLRAFLLLVLLPVLVGGRASASPATVEQVLALQEGGDSAGAYALALRHRGRLEGEPAFDYAYGVAAIDSGHVDEGLFALERVLMLQPDHHLARLELARGYFLGARYEHARKEFETVLATSPPEAVRRNIEHFLEAIERQQAGIQVVNHGFIEAGWGYDGNVNGGPEDPTFLTPTLGIGVLNDSAMETADHWREVAAGFETTASLPDGDAAFAQISARLRDHVDTTDFDTRQLRATAGLARARGTNIWRVKVHAEGFDVDRERFRTHYAAGVEWHRLASQDTRYTVFGETGHQRYADQPLRDGVTLVLGGSVQHRFRVRWNPALVVSAVAGADLADEGGALAEATGERRVAGLRASVALAPDERHRIGAGVFGQVSRYGGAHPVFEVTREDTAVGLELSASRTLMEGLTLGARVDFLSNDSNIPVNEYDRLRAGVTLRYRF